MKALGILSALDDAVIRRGGHQENDGEPHQDKTHEMNVL